MLELLWVYSERGYTALAYFRTLGVFAVTFREFYPGLCCVAEMGIHASSAANHGQCWVYL